LKFKLFSVIHQQTKTHLPLLFVDSDPNDSESDIFSVTSILHTKIKIEEPYKKRQMPQCQTANPTATLVPTYCAYSLMCVKCGGEHLSTNCVKSPDLPAKCEGAHPVIYKECTEKRNEL